MATKKHSEKFDTVQAFYLTYKVWSIERVRNAVAQNWITAEEFKEITGQDYEA